MKKLSDACPFEIEVEDWAELKKIIDASLKIARRFEPVGRMFMSQEALTAVGQVLYSGMPEEIPEAAADKLQALMAYADGARDRLVTEMRNDLRL